DQVKDDLTTNPKNNISQVEIAGIRKYEISIEVSEHTLRKFGLTFDSLARVIGNSSLDLPAGSIKTKGGEILVRTQGQMYFGKEFEKIVVLTRNDGTRILLKDIAEVIDGFEDSDIAARFKGQPAVMLNIFRLGDQGALDVSRTVRQYVKENKSQLPHGVSIDIYADASEILESRIDLLTRNAYIGITLVLLCLTLFLDLKLAFWTTLGIPISFMGAFFLLPYFDISINMLSLFAFILVLGIVVDDAIVVGENIFEYRQQGMPPLQASITGVREMAAPVTMAILTTIAAFAPLVFIEGMMGKFIRNIPIVAICVISLSLIEAFYILPAHLASSRIRKTKGPLARFQQAVRNSMDRFIQGPFARIVTGAVKWRYITLATAIASFLITVGFIAGGHLKFVFFGTIEADEIVVALSMPQGTSRQETDQVVVRLENALKQLEQEFKETYPNEPPVVRNMITYLGEQPFTRAMGGPHGGGVTNVSGSHLAELYIQLSDGEFRGISSNDLTNKWKELVGDIVGVESLTFTSTFFSPGESVNVELTHRDFDTLLEAADDLKKRLAVFEGISEISDSFETGKREIKLSLKEKGRTLGLTLEELARQVRQGFYGQEVQRIQRGRDDIRVMLRYPKAERNNIHNITNMRIRLKDGTEVPFSVAAESQQGRGFAIINRADRKRIVRVTADVDENVGNAFNINQQLRNEVIPKLQRDYPGLNYSLRGQEQQQMESLASLYTNFPIALLVIFGLLAVQFRSYVQPLIIMSAIPFGLIGAVIGHIIMGFDLSFLSMFGIVALTGVVVNDSLILIDLINRRCNEAQPHTPNSPTLENNSDTYHAAPAGPSLEEISKLVLASTLRRFRPIILTTLTTCCGLLPILLEKSLQARFLIPMAISLAFGVLFATLITLVLVPSLYMILEDAKRLFRRKNSG
ncbi:MAG: efflux RND transporter permease subunit, partial [Planctomycetes bacterium]|nr:efflux RND transporter permease subunit [Planctomycetota bacterium]